MPAVDRIHLVRTRPDGEPVEAIRERTGLSQIGATIAQPVRPDGPETAARVKRQLTFELDCTAMIIGEEILRARRQPLDRAAKLLGHIQHEGIFGKWRSARSERTAHIDHVNPDSFRRHIHHGRKRISHREPALVSTADLVGLCLCVVRSERCTQFHRRRCNARTFHPHVHDVVSPLDQLIGFRGIAILKVEANIVWNG